MRVVDDMAPVSVQQAPTLGGADDVPSQPGEITWAERQAITRRKRERRKREGIQAITTGRDEALSGVAAFAARELLKMPEVRSRLARAARCHEALRAAAHQGIPGTDQGFRSLRVGLETLATDFGGVLGDACNIACLVDNWPQILKRSDDGWPVRGLMMWTGRSGTESSMPTESIMLALKSIALRPAARAEVNSERTRGLRGGRVRYQRGHEHSVGTRAHGAIRADELAAAEINRRDSRPKAYEITAKAVREARERLRSVLAELEPAAPTSGECAHEWQPPTAELVALSLSMPTIWQFHEGTRECSRCRLLQLGLAGPERAA
jgi:hypothetical protein